MINYKDLLKEDSGVFIVLSPQQIIEETQAESGAQGFIDKHAIEFRGYTNYYYSLN